MGRMRHVNPSIRVSLAPLLAVAAALAGAGCNKPDLEVREAPRFAATPPNPGDPPTNPTDPTDPHTTTTPPVTPTTTFTPPEGDPYSPVPVPADLPQGALDDIAADIDDIVGSTVASTGVYVVDAENGQVVYGNDEDDPKTPASNTKLFTTGLAFDVLGQDHRMEVSAWADQPVAGDGSVGDLTIVGEHDFTWSTFFYATPEFAAERLVDALWDAGLRAVDGTLTVAGEYEVEGYQFGTYDAAYYRDAAAGVLLDAFAARGIDVADSATSSSFAAPAGATLLARRGSEPLSVACHPLNVYSHNEFADILSHHEGYTLGAASTYAEGTAQVVDWLDGAGIDTTGLDLNDGSGLSHSNFVTPRQVVSMLSYMADRPAGLAWQRTFSTAGVLGTLGARMTGGDTLGRFLGKTGTLTGVIATSGVLYHRYDGHRYYVSVLMNDVVDDTYARSLEDDVVEVIARDHRVSGTRPAQVVLRSVRAPGDGTLVLDWDPVEGVDGYAVWLSDDGAVWRRDDARFVQSGADGFVAGGLAVDSVQYVRVSAIAAGREGDPSDVLAARVSLVPPELLLVDADDRWATQWENPMGRGHDFLVPHAAALGGDVPFESVANEVVGDSEVDLSDYAAVVWVLGEESSIEETFDDVEQVLIADAVAGGTALLVSGAELGWDLSELGSPSDQAFFADTLRAGYLADDADSYTLEAAQGGLFDGIGELGFYTPGTEEIAFPDQLQAANGSTVELRYVGGLGGAAALAYDDGTERVVVFGFPFETIDDAASRALVMGRILDRFGL